MRRILTTLITAALLLLASAANADDACETDEDATPIGLGDRTFYVINDICQPVVGSGECLFSLWVYEETNGQPGLQRDDEFGEHCEGDTIIL